MISRIVKRLANITLLAFASILLPLTMADNGGSSSKDENQPCQTAVKRFIQEPNSRNYAAVSNPGTDHCWSTLTVEQSVAGARSAHCQGQPLSRPASGTTRFTVWMGGVRRRSSSIRPIRDTSHGRLSEVVRIGCAH
jgi:hypothetical protein